MAAPGAVDTVIVTGSGAIGDWWPGVSDIDAVFVLARPLTASDTTALTDLHADTITDGPIDGIYLTPTELGSGPDAIGTATQSIGGRLRAEQAGDQLSWITWREIENGYEAQAGPDGLRFWRRSARRFPRADAGARAYCRRNLHDYWGPLAETVRTQLDGRHDHDEVSSTTLQWIALGPARLVATIETGQILSKTSAAAYAARRWPDQAALLERAAAARSGNDVTFIVADAYSALRLFHHCLVAAEPIQSPTDPADRPPRPHQS